MTVSGMVLSGVAGVAGGGGGGTAVRPISIQSWSPRLFFLALVPERPLPTTTTPPQPHIAAAALLFTNWNTIDGPPDLMKILNGDRESSRNETIGCG